MEKDGDIVYIYPRISRQYTRYYLYCLGENVEKCIKYNWYIKTIRQMCMNIDR